MNGEKGEFNGLLCSIYGLRALSAVIASLGVVNTLAIGGRRSQLRSVIRLESMVIGVLGALLCTALGVAPDLA